MVKYGDSRLHSDCYRFSLYTGKNNKNEWENVSTDGIIPLILKCDQISFVKSLFL